MCKNALKSDSFIDLFPVVVLQILSEYLKPLDSYVIFCLVPSLEVPRSVLFSSEAPVFSFHCALIQSVILREMVLTSFTLKAVVMCHLEVQHVFNC